MYASLPLLSLHSASSQINKNENLSTIATCVNGQAPKVQFYS